MEKVGQCSNTTPISILKITFDNNIELCGVCRSMIGHIKCNAIGQNPATNIITSSVVSNLLPTGHLVIH